MKKFLVIAVVFTLTAFAACRNDKTPEAQAEAAVEELNKVEKTVDEALDDLDKKAKEAEKALKELDNL